MKSSLKRPVLALALALALAGCGGKATFTIGGVAYGVKYNGMTLTTNGQTIAVNPAVEGTEAPAGLPFAFPKTIEYGEVYKIEMPTPPAHQTCTLAYNSDTAGRLASINAVVTCSLALHPLSGKITGLASDGLVLTNGTNGGTVPLNGTTTTNTDGTTTTTYPGSFVFAIPVAYGDTFGVTVLKQPARQTCTVANGTGIQGDADANNIAVTCVNN
jgi:hypothetical protein